MSGAPPIDTALVDLLAHALTGHTEPLAKHLETGGHIDQPTREFLAATLRGEVRRKRGNTRTHSQRQMELEAVLAVRALQFESALDRGSRGSRSIAINRYLELNPSANENTLNDYLKRNGGSLSKDVLAAIDRAREEIRSGGQTG